MPRKRTLSPQAFRFGRYLAALRAAKQYTQRQVEKLTDRQVSNAYLSQIEKGQIRRPSPTTLFHLARAYGVPYERLLERVYPTPQTTPPEQAPPPVYSVEHLTEDEERALLAYLAFYRKLARGERG